MGKKEVKVSEIKEEISFEVPRVQVSTTDEKLVKFITELQWLSSLITLRHLLSYLHNLDIIDSKTYYPADDQLVKKIREALFKVLKEVGIEVKKNEWK